MSESIRYLFIARLKSDSDLDRVKQVAPDILQLLTRFSNGEQENVFRSNDGQLFGVFLRTAINPHIIRAEFEKLTSTENGDDALIIEVGEGRAGIGFSRAWTWLQHH